MSREEIQKEAIVAWVDNGKKGTIVLPTGLGKMKVAVDIVGRQLKNNVIQSTLIVVPTIPLIQQFKEEFNKWGFDTAGIDFMCIKSAYKIDKYYDLLVVDEIHTAVGPEYRKVFTNIKYTQILGLTATLPKEEVMDVIHKYCDVVYTKTIKDIDQQGIVADFIILNAPIKLSRKEQQKYNKFNQLFAAAQLRLNILKSKDEHLRKKAVFDIAKEFSAKKDVTKDIEDIVKSAKQYWSAMSLRKWSCYDSEEKCKEAVKIVLKHPNKKWIIFNKSIKMAHFTQTLLGDDAVVYHSKMNDEEREKALDSIRNNDKKWLVAVDALNAGLNIPDIDAAICISGVSTELVNVQQLGRIIRLKSTKSIFINFYCEGTIEETWVAKKTKMLPNTNWIKLSDIDKWIEQQNTKHFVDT